METDEEVQTTTFTQKAAIATVMASEKTPIDIQNLTNHNPKNENRYTALDLGPFQVILEKEQINELKTGLSITKAGIKNIIEIKKIGKNRIKITLNDYKMANNILNNQTINKIEKYNSFIPNMYIETVGIIKGVDTDIELDDIINHTESSLKINRIERITKWDHIKQTANPTHLIKVYFRANTTPATIKILSVVKDVHLFIPKPTICHNCLRYGHTQKICKSANVCKNCAESHDGECTKATTCKYCKNTHSTLDRNCPELKKQEEIKREMISQNLSYHELMNKKRATPNIINNSSFPTLSNANHNTNNATYNEMAKHHAKHNKSIEEKDKIITEQRIALEKIQDILNKITNIIEKNINNKNPANIDLTLIEISEAIKDKTENKTSKTTEITKPKASVSYAFKNKTTINNGTQVLEPSPAKISKMATEFPYYGSLNQKQTLHVFENHEYAHTKSSEEKISHTVQQSSNQRNG